jgi:hypothetical protein
MNDSFLSEPIKLTNKILFYLSTLSLINCKGRIKFEFKSDKILAYRKILFYKKNLGLIDNKLWVYWFIKDEDLDSDCINLWYLVVTLQDIICND